MYSSSFLHLFRLEQKLAHSEEKPPGILTLGCAFIILQTQRLNKCLIEKKKQIGGTAVKNTYRIEVDCANCANKMELAAKKTDGVKNANVSFMTQKMTVEFEEGRDAKTVMREVLKNCRKVEDDCEIFF